MPGGRDNVGRWRGVGVLSKTSVRHLPQCWPAEVTQSCRAMAFTTFVDDAWVTGGIVYGEPDARHYPDRLAHNELLLHSVASSVCHLAKGPRFVAGDWNVKVGTLPVFDLLHAAGFRDLQDLAEERWGATPQPTCKHATRCDFCFVSPEFQQLLLGVDVIDDIWPDHAIIQGRFGRLRNVVPRQVWRVPSAFPWPNDFPVLPTLWTDADGSPEQKYACVWSAIEQSASAVVPYSVPKSAKGRGATKCVSKAHARGCPPVRVGRQGDFQPHFHGASLRHAQWLRQVRRLQAYIRCVRSSEVVSPHGARVWAAIRTSSGFHEGFSAWWASCDGKVHGAPNILPMLPPPADVASRIFDTVAISLRKLEAQLCATSVQYARMRRAANPSLLFRDIKAPATHGVDFLMQATRAVVQEVRPEDCSVVLDRPCTWHPELPVRCGTRPIAVIHEECTLAFRKV